MLCLYRHISDVTHSYCCPVSSSTGWWQLPLSDQFSHSSHDFLVNNDAEPLFCHGQNRAQNSVY